MTKGVGYGPDFGKVMPRILDSSCPDNWSNPCPRFWTAVCWLVLGMLAEKIEFCTGFRALDFCGGWCVRKLAFSPAVAG